MWWRSQWAAAGQIRSLQRGTRVEVELATFVVSFFLPPPPLPLQLPSSSLSSVCSPPPLPILTNTWHPPPPSQAQVLPTSSQGGLVASSPATFSPTSIPSNCFPHMFGCLNALPSHCCLFCSPYSSARPEPHSGLTCRRGGRPPQTSPPSSSPETSHIGQAPPSLATIQQLKEEFVQACKLISLIRPLPWIETYWQLCQDLTTTGHKTKSV